jgi:hypothetical protein
VGLGGPCTLGPGEGVELGGPCTPRLDDVMGVTQGGPTESPPIPWVGQPDPLLSPALEVTLLGLGAGTWLLPALGVAILGLAPEARLLPALEDTVLGLAPEA